jgi:hypothetical protein
MFHVADHYRHHSEPEQARPDFWTIDYMLGKKLISEDNYRWALRHTERPSCDGLVPLGYETQEMKIKQERSLRELHDLGKEDRLRRRIGQPIAGKGKLKVFEGGSAGIVNVGLTSAQHDEHWAGSPSNPVSHCSLKQPGDHTATLRDISYLFPQAIVHKRSSIQEGEEEASETSNLRAHLRVTDKPDFESELLLHPPEGVQYRRVPDNGLSTLPHTLQAYNN